MKEFLYKVATDQKNGIPISLLKVVLWLLSLIYGLGVGVILFLYRQGLLKQNKLNKPVISVGNITLGGVGKTPLVIYIAQYLEKKGLKAAVLTRGYMGSKENSGNNDSDEADMLRKVIPNVPVIVGKNRYENALEFQKKNPVDIFLLDDGFQHFSLYRDLDIVAIDTTNPFGNGKLIPRGILRESPNALVRAQVCVLTKTNLGQKNLGGIRERLQSVKSGKDIYETIHEPLELEDLRSGKNMSLALIKEAEVCSFCSIGNPASFQETLVSLGSKVKGHFDFMDHHLYTRTDIQEVNAFCRQNKIKIVVTTQKDAVKLGQITSLFDQSIGVFALTMRIAFTQREGEFLGRIDHLSHR